MMAKDIRASKRYKHKPGALPTDQEFEAGISFTCKYIGNSCVLRPGSRNEILSAMRKVRDECNAQNIKKRKVILEVCVDGVRTYLDGKIKAKTGDSDDRIIEDPIYRIFYVSHDSQDSKIFSYICRKKPEKQVENGSVVVVPAEKQFMCHVYKAFKRTEAVAIVQSIGRVFEVCNFIADGMNHKVQTLNSPTDDNTQEVKQPAEDKQKDNSKDAEIHIMNKKYQEDDILTQRKSLELEDSTKSHETLNSDKTLEDSVFEKDGNDNLPDTTIVRELNEAQELLTAISQKEDAIDPEKNKLSTTSSPYEEIDLNAVSNRNMKQSRRISQPHEMQLLWLQLEQQELQISSAFNQVELLRQQLALETKCRADAEYRCHQLLLHNKDLLEHINRLSTENKQLREKLSHNSQECMECIGQNQVIPSNSQLRRSPSIQSAGMSPDSGHKDMTSNTSISDHQEESEYKGGQLMERYVSTYELPDEYGNNLSLDDIAVLRSSFIANERDSEHIDSSPLYEIPQPRYKKNSLPTHSRPDASTLMRHLMLFESEKKLSRKNLELESKSLNNSVDEIYGKINNIRRSLETIDNVVGRQLTVLSTSAALFESTPAGKQMQSMPILNGDYLDEEEDPVFYPDSDDSEADNNSDEQQSLSPRYFYENVTFATDGSMTLPTGALIKSAFTKRKPSAMNKNQYKSLVTLPTVKTDYGITYASTTSLNSRYSPQKETTLSKKIETKTLSQNSIHIINADNSGDDANDKTGKINSTHKDRENSLNRAENGRGSLKIKTKAINRHYSVSKYKSKEKSGGNSGKKIQQTDIRKKDKSKSLKPKPSQKMITVGFYPLQESERFVSLDSLNSVPDTIEE